MALTLEEANRVIAGAIAQGAAVDVGEAGEEERPVFNRLEWRENPR